MDSKELSRRGGIARAKRLSKKRRKEIASIAGKASVEARRKKAQMKEKKRNG